MLSHSAPEYLLQIFTGEQIAGNGSYFYLKRYIRHAGRFKYFENFHGLGLQKSLQGAAKMYLLLRGNFFCKAHNTYIHMYYIHILVLPAGNRCIK